MDKIPMLELRWCQGYNGSTVEFIDQEVLCFVSGNSVKFLAEDGRETGFTFPGDGIKVLAVHALNRLFAIAETGLDPKIFVHAYPTFRTVSVLEGGAKLEVTHLTFSTSDYLASVSTLPDYMLTLWQHETGQKLANVVLSHVPVTSVTFNTGNWRQLCITTETELTVWQTEQSDKSYMLQPTKIRLPPEDPSQVEEQDEKEYAEGNEQDGMVTRASTRMTKYTVDIPRAAIAGLVGPMAEMLDEIEDIVVRVKPVANVWSEKGDVYITCKGGQVLCVDGELWKARVLYNPFPVSRCGDPTRTFSTASKLSLSHNRTETADPVVESSLPEGALECLRIHRDGLFVAGQDGVLRVFDISNTDEVSITKHCDIGMAIKSLAFNPPYNKLVIGSAKGAIQIYNPTARSADPIEPEDVSDEEAESSVVDPLSTLIDYHYGQIVSIGMLSPGTEQCLTLREDGELQVWDIEAGRQLRSFSVGVQCTTMVCCVLYHVAVVGATSGHLYFLDFSNLNKIRIIHRLRVYNSPISHLMFSQSGQYIVTAGKEDEHIYVIHGLASNNFDIIGHTVVAPNVESLTMCTDTANGDINVAAICHTQNENSLGATKLFTFDLSGNFCEVARHKYYSIKLNFNDVAINKMELNLSTPVYSAMLSSNRMLFAISQENEKILRFKLPEELPNRDSRTLSPVEKASGQELAGGHMVMSAHHKMIMTYGPDGKVYLRNKAAMQETAPSFMAHDYHMGGVTHAFLTDDCQHVLTTNKQGYLACIIWETMSLASRAKSAIDAARARRSKCLQQQQAENEALRNKPDWSAPETVSQSPTGEIGEQNEMEREETPADVQDDVYRTPTPVPLTDATWLENKEHEAHKEEDQQYAQVKKNIRLQIQSMRKTVQTMMRENETLPEIEKLGRHEFDLDVEEQQRLQAEGEAEVQRIREEIELENLAKMYLRDVIKQECWDEMDVKGRTIQAFNSSLEVSNYPTRARSKQAVHRLETTIKRRQVEIAEIEAGKELLEVGKKPAVVVNDDAMEGEDDDENQDTSEHPSTTGSLGAQFGGANELFYSQFSMNTREQKINQIILLEDAIYRIKKQCNAEFDEVIHRKEQEITKVKDKNRRIRKILSDLDLIEDVVEPELGIAEKPEKLLTVEDSEVTVEKFLTANQMKKKEESDKLDEQRRLQEQGDNWRDRGLDLMMGGLLEIKKEDELKQDVPVPAFMNNKAEADWSEEEQKQAKEYERKVKELQEEREKYRKQLETELRKLQAFIQESMVAFDEALQQLFMRKMRTQMVIYQEELKIVRLRIALLTEEELETRETELTRLLEHKKLIKQLSAQASLESRKQVEAFREQYDIMLAEDRVLEKAFKREFNDCTALQIDQLFKLFRKRPRTQKLKEIQVLDPNAPNPFSERPSTARRDNMAQKMLDNYFVDLDKESNAPEGLEFGIWERLCLYRKDKVKSETLVKQKANTMADMMAFMTKRQEEDERLRNEIDDIMQEINRIRDDKLRFSCNLEVQLLLKQGQVEVDAGSFIHSYSDSVLIHRSVVEDLNSTIKQLGESKIASMVESKDFRKGIIQLEWEHKRMVMQLQDLQTRMSDIQFMKVTREIQAFLNEADYDAKKAQEIAILEQTILLQKKHHDKNIKHKKTSVHELNSIVKHRGGENDQITTELNELNVSLNERKHINDVNADRHMDTGVEQRYQEIVQRRKLVDLAKAQAQEVAVLRAEVERLRMRTFPALVQVER